jgi:ketosteroid isomerase-like protein
LILKGTKINNSINLKKGVIMTAQQQHDKAIEAFNNHDADKVVEFYSADAILTDPSYNEPQIGRDAIRKDYEKLFRSFPDISVSRQEFLDNGSSAVWEVKLSGTNTGPHRDARRHHPCY